MEADKFELQPDPSLTLFGLSWGQRQMRPKATMLILHGMGEHIERYAHFASHLAEQGYVIYGYDQRGHGRTDTGTATHGYLGPNGFSSLITDADMAVKWIKSQYPQTPVILFGHSMGSFVAQSYVLEHSRDIDACILCGSNGPEGVMLRIGRWLARRYAKRHGAYAESKTLTKLTFGQYNKPFRPNQTPFDWLTRDTDALAAYLADPLCGFPLSAASMFDMFDQLMQMYQLSKVRLINRNFPIFIIAGEADPVGHQGKGIQKLIQVYQSCGLERVSKKIYPQARHELLHELNRIEVYADVVDWIDKLKLS